MQHIINKTGLGLIIAHVVEELDLLRDKDSINSMLIDIFTSKFEQFKKRHSSKFPSTSLHAYYFVENQYPVGQNDIHQYFRALAYQVKIGNGTLSLGSKEDRRNFTIIQGYSRNQSFKKRVGPKVPKGPSNDYNWRQARMRQIGKTEPIKRTAEGSWKDYHSLKKRLNLRKSS